MVGKPRKLKKQLELFDVFAISTGAMFSSGFFLLPGLAMALCGPSVIFAYLLASILVLPAMFSKAELSTAMPKAGGTYYFLDRSLGPLIGTVGGLGVYMALVLKTAFTLIGIGAYLAVIVSLPIKPVAIGLTSIFLLLNYVGSKVTAGFQKVILIFLLMVLCVFVVAGAQSLFELGSDFVIQRRFLPLLPFGMNGFFGAVGFVIVSYAGLTKVASVAEEVKNPDRNIPLGMILSLLVTTFFYVAGVSILVGLIHIDYLSSNLTPIVTASLIIFDHLPATHVIGVSILAAIAAFFMTGNAGVLSSSRFPFAMAKDKLVPSILSRLNRFHTPGMSILLTGFLLVLCIVTLSEEGLAKLASAFQLFIFVIINFSVIVMRESRIESYDPGYRSPWYPWMQIMGIITNFALIIYMGKMVILSVLILILICFIWYRVYARHRVVRHGAIYHWFAHLGRYQYNSLDNELWEIMREKGLREKDPYNMIIEQAYLVDLKEKETDYSKVLSKVCQLLARRVLVSKEDLIQGFLSETKWGSMPIFKGVCFPGLRLSGITKSSMVMVRSKKGIILSIDDIKRGKSKKRRFHALFFLLSPEEKSRQHLRILAKIAEKVEDEQFLRKWLIYEKRQTLKTLILQEERMLYITINREDKVKNLINRPLKEMLLPEGSLVALIRREQETLVPHGDTILREGDLLSVIGNKKSLKQCKDTYG